MQKNPEFSLSFLGDGSERAGDSEIPFLWLRKPTFQLSLIQLVLGASVQN